MLGSLRIILLLVLLPGVSVRAGDPAIDHVLVVSVDGLRSDAIMAPSRTSLPNLRRLVSASSTLNARTVPSHTLTLPNHASMTTGRLVMGDGGHGCTRNSHKDGDPLLHELAGGYVASMFDVAHDHGVFTAMLATKTKFEMLDKTWDGDHGAADGVSPDNGPDKIDRCVLRRGSSAVTDAALESLAAGHERTLLFVHYAAPDGAGHGSGWDLTVGSDYLLAVAAVDREIGRLLAAITENATLDGRTAIILTADHGGGAPHKSHWRPEMWVNYIIPFLVWTGDDATGGDLYEMNQASRRDPGLTQPTAGADPPPIRNADAPNLALHLLGLPAVPGSTVNARQELRVRP